MLPTIRSLVLRYGLAVVVTCLVAAAKLFMEPLTGDESPFLLFVLAVIVSAWYGGFGPALFATGLSALLSDYFFISPGRVIVGNSLTGSVRLGLFVAEGFIIGWVVASFVAAREALREAGVRKNDFIAVLAHELRNCLAPLQLASQMLEPAARDNSPVSQARGFLERQVAHMARLVDDLLESSRAVRSKIELSKEVVDLRSACEEAAQASEPLLDDRSQKLTISLPSAPLRLEADPIRLRQILMNLLANASKYSGKGGRIWLSAEREHRHLVLRVRDQGVGIAPEMLPHVFEPFAQTRRAARASGGLGVGLALARTLVELHGGRITVRSEGLGHGSEFLVWLPCISFDTHDDSPRAAVQEHASPGK